MSVEGVPDAPDSPGWLGETFDAKSHPPRSAQTPQGDVVMSEEAIGKYSIVYQIIPLD